MATNTSDFFTFSKTAGTAKNLQKPTDGGDNNLWGGYINVDLDTIVGAVNATSDLIADANQNELVDFTATGSAVNHVGITNAATGNGPTIEAKGDDTNIDLNVSGKGTGALTSTGAKLTSPKVITGVNDTNGNELVKVTATGSAVNEITVANAATGNGPTLSATGDDTNIDLNIAGKGTGDPKMVDLKVTNIKANDGTAGISIADSTGRLTVTETNPVIQLGSNATFPAGHVIQVKQVVDDTIITRTGDKSSWAAVTGMSVTLDNNIQSGSKLLASYSGVYGEAQGSWWAVRTWFTIFQNSTNVIGNQVTSTRDLGLNAVGSTTSAQQYWNENFSASVLFTPTGTDTAKKTVALYWKNQGSASFTSYLNSTNAASGSTYTGGACVLTLMEIAG